MSQNIQIVHDFNIPDHKEELNKANELIINIKTKFKNVQLIKIFDGKTHLNLYDETILALDYIGRLSEMAFALEDEMEEYYFKTYSNSPQLAKKLFLSHYAKINQPYNLLKNRCFKILDELDKEYYKINKKHPLNWKI